MTNDNEQQMTNPEQDAKIREGVAEQAESTERLVEILTDAPARPGNEATVEILDEGIEQPRDREWLLGQGEGLGFADSWPKDAAEFAARWNLWGPEYRERHVRRYVEYASRHIANLEQAGGMAIEAGWIVEVHRECTCGQGLNAPYGHEPGCGYVPIATVESALVALTALGGAQSSTVWTASYTPADHPRRAHVVEIHSAVSAEDALDRAAAQPNAPGRNAIRVIETTNRTITSVREVQP